MVFFCAYFFVVMTYYCTTTWYYKDSLKKNQTMVHTPITQWAEDDRPREKMLLKGKNALSDAELIAILLATGTKEYSAVDLAKQIMTVAQNDLNLLARMTIADLRKIKGIGPAKAITIAAAMELGGRKKAGEIKQKSISSSRDAYEYFGPKLEDKAFEEFHVLLLNRANKVITEVQISEGGVAGTYVDPKKIFKLALEHGACSIILCHNHPSGGLVPSQQDINITQKIVSAGKLLEIMVLDHLIISIAGFYSFADEGMLKSAD
jgi:DNA repair protein RadC